jgi:hypothetical protein
MHNFHRITYTNFLIKLCKNEETTRILDGYSELLLKSEEIIVKGIMTFSFILTSSLIRNNFHYSKPI